MSDTHELTGSMPCLFLPILTVPRQDEEALPPHCELGKTIQGHGGSDAFTPHDPCRARDAGDSGQPHDAIQGHRGSDVFTPYVTCRARDTGYSGAKGP